MQAFETIDLLEQMIERTGGAPSHGVEWHEFLRSPSLSMGIYVLDEGALDPQKPHTEDEVYYVIGGRGEIEVEGETRRVGPGSIVFVAAQAEHRFRSITEALTLLVFFAPAEYSQAATGRAE